MGVVINLKLSFLGHGSPEARVDGTRWRHSALPASLGAESRGGGTVKCFTCYGMAGGTFVWSLKPLNVPFKPLRFSGVLDCKKRKKTTTLHVVVPGGSCNATRPKHPSKLEPNQPCTQPYDQHAMCMINQPTNPPCNQPISHAVKLSRKQPRNHPYNQPCNSTMQPTSQQCNQPTMQPYATNRATNQP